MKRRIAELTAFDEKKFGFFNFIAVFLNIDLACNRAEK